MIPQNILHVKPAVTFDDPLGTQTCTEVIIKIIAENDVLLDILPLYNTKI